MTVSSPAPLAWYQRSVFDWTFALLAVLAGAMGFWRFSAYLDYYEQGILVLVVPALIAFAWHWRAIGRLSLLLGALGALSVHFYAGDLNRAEHVFFLKYGLSTQSAILWMATLFALSLVIAWAGLIVRSQFAASVARSLTWAAVVMGFTGLLARWYVSYLVTPGGGHIPVSNLYEVFVLFCLITALLVLYYGKRFALSQLLPFALLIINAAVGFIIWYAYAKGAHEIQPLIPALQSWWMKIHVPANFIGYGGFAFAAMVGLAYLLTNTPLASRLPAPAVLDEVMYKSIAIGFLFFTIATILGALWAAEAWGGYWSWDPKEVAALVVWLNYAAWLHLRLIHGMRGMVLAWWAIIGLLVTTFAFIGVNLWLSGLHSYGGL